MSLQASEPSPVDPTPPNKRRKTQLACHPCRARKTGCDGQRPYCRSCIMRSWQDRCSYQETGSRSSSALTLVDLDKRLQKLEEAAYVQVPIVSSVREGNDSTDFVVSSIDRHENPHHQSTAVQETSVSVDCVPVYGISSNSSFVQQVASVVGSSYEHVDKTGTGIGSLTSRPATIDYNLKDLILPPRQLTDSLLQCYWELFHPIYPVLHRPTFHAVYSQLWQPIEVTGLATLNKTQDVAFYSLLNITLALGCQRGEALAEAEREDLANELYSRSVRLVSADALDTSSLQIVQLMLLRGFYLLRTPHADRCWITAGIAFRVAQAVNLQSATTTAASNQLDREMRRRVWYNCVLLDWYTCLAFDRPLALSKETPVPSKNTPVSMPEPIDDEYLWETGEGQQPQGLPSRLEFFVYAMKLLDIKAKSRIAETQHLTTGRKRYSAEELGASLDMVSDLDHFLEDLPNHLQRDRGFALPESGNETCFKLQARVLRARVMYTRLSILRPIIVAEAHRYFSSTATDRDVTKTILDVQNTLCTLCVSTAHETLEVLHDQLSTVYRSSPWHTLYFTFASASVLVAATLCPYLGLQLDQNPGKASWDKAMRIFTFHKAHVASAEKGIEALERFRNYIETRGARGNAARSLGSDFRSTPASGSGFVVSSLAFESNSTGQNLPEVNNLTDLVPMDESWFVSQDFLFDDGIIQWQ